MFLPRDPQGGTNRYAYAGQNSVSWTDPSGMRYIEIGAGSSGRGVVAAGVGAASSPVVIFRRPRCMWWEFWKLDWDCMNRNAALQLPTLSLIGLCYGCILATGITTGGIALYAGCYGICAGAWLTTQLIPMVCDPCKG